MKVKALFIAVATLFLAATAQAQDIQDTFFDLKFGNVINVDDVKANVGDSGVFKYTMDRGKFTEIIFWDTVFENSTWKLADFYTDTEGRLFRFRLSTNYADRDQAMEEYNAVKAQLDEKYRLYYTKGGGDNILNRYDGTNDMKLMLTFSLSTSLGGDQFYYINLDYILWSVYQGL